MKKLLFVVLFGLLPFIGCDKISENLPILTQSEVATGLKEALKVGTGNAVDIVGVLDGFYKNSEIMISIPQEISFIKNLYNIPIVGNTLKNTIDQFEEKLNRAAENAAKSATEVFVEAITQMTISDAISILKGDDNAATQYLERTTSTILYEKFYPLVSGVTQQIELADYWEQVSNAYNKVLSTGLFEGEEINMDLNDYVTDKALDGIFVMVAKEEKKIRTDPAARVNEILQKVFGSSLNPHNVE